MPISIERRWELIEKEFGYPIKDLLERWRKDSTYKTMSKAIGVHTRTLRRWRRLLDLPIGDERKTDEFSVPESRIDRRAKRLGFDDAADLIRCYKLDPHHWVDWQIADLLGCSMMTVYRHKPKELRGIQNLSPKGRKKLSECGKKTGGKPRADHPWKELNG